MDYTEVSIETTRPGAEELTAVLEDVAQGFVIDDSQDVQDLLDAPSPRWDYIDERLVARKSDQTGVTLRFYLEDSEDGQLSLAEARQRVEQLKSQGEEALGSLSMTVRPVRSEDWENNWKQYYKPLAIGEKLLVVPEWLNPENPENRVVVLLDPGMIFGTGAHASTQMCMRELERAIQGGEQVLDLGSGSGILSITALLLGASHATGVDIDPKAEDIARQNAAINQIFADRFTALTGDVIGDTAMMEKLEAHYDVVLANIVADVIIPLAPVVPHFLGEDSVFICSGILNTRLSEVISALEAAGLQVLSTEQQEDWCRVTAVLAG